MGSKSRTELLALLVSWWIMFAYWTVVELSSVVLTGIPVEKDVSSLCIHYSISFLVARCVSW